MNLQFLEPSTVEGVIHVAPPKVVIEDGSKVWSNSLVGYFIGSKLPFSVVNNIARKIWSKEGLVDVLAHSRGFFFSASLVMQELMLSWKRTLGYLRVDT